MKKSCGFCKGVFEVIIIDRGVNETNDVFACPLCGMSLYSYRIQKVIGGWENEDRFQ